MEIYETLCPIHKGISSSLLIPPLPQPFKMSKPEKETSEVPFSFFNLTQGQAILAPGLTLGYLLPLPLVSKLCQKNGLVEKTILPLALSTFKYLGLGEVKQGKIPTALLLGGFVSTYVLSATISIGGQATGKDGYLNKEPRARRGSLNGFGLRLMSAHLNMMEFFSAIAGVSVLAQILAPDSYNNELALLYVVKSFLYPLAYYVEGLDVFRSMTHFTSVSIVLRILYRLAFA